MAEEIGALRVMLMANAAQFADDMRKAKGAVQTAGAAMNRSFNALRGGVSGLGKDLFSLRNALLGGSAAAMVLFVKRMAETADEIESTSKAIGITAEELQQMRYVASQLGTDQDALTSALGRFTKGIGEAVQGTGAARKGFGDLGITIADLRNLTPLEVFSMVADRLSAIEDPARRAAIASQFFGKGWQDIAPMLLSGGAAIDALRVKASKLGIVVSNEMISKAAAVGDEFDTLGAVFRTAGISLAGEFLPMLKDVAGVMTSPEFQKGVKDFATWTGNAAKYISDNIDTIERFAAAFLAMRAGAALGGAIAGPRGAAIGGFIGGMSGYIAGPDAIRNLGGSRPGGADFAKPGYKQPATTSELLAQLNVLGPAKTSAPGGGAYDPDDEGKWQKVRQQAKDRIADMRTEATTLGLGTYEIEKRRMALELTQQVTKADLTLTPAISAQIASLCSNVYAAQVVELNRLREAQERVQQAAKQSFDAVSSGFKDFITGAKTAEEALGNVLAKLGEIALNNWMEKLFAPSSDKASGGAFGGIFNFLGSILGFADGGVMTGRGPLALRRYQSGGIASTPQLALYGEGDDAEAYVPLPDGRRIPVHMTGGGGGQAGGDQHFHFSNVDPGMRAWVQQMVQTATKMGAEGGERRVRHGRANTPSYFAGG